MKSIIISALVGLLILPALSGCKTVGAIKEDFNSVMNDSTDATTESLNVPSDRRQLAREVQTMLTEKGYDPGPIDGQPGPSTNSALRSFQSARGLSFTDGVTQEAYIQLASDDEADRPNQDSVEDSRECVRNFKEQSGIRNYRTNATLDGVSQEIAFQRLIRALGRKGFVINENDSSRGYVNATFGAGTTDIQITAFINGGNRNSNVELNYANTGTGFLAVLLVPASSYRNELCGFIEAMQTGV